MNARSRLRFRTATAITKLGATKLRFDPQGVSLCSANAPGWCVEPVVSLRRLVRLLTSNLAQSDDQRPLVQECRHLLPISRNLHGREWRRRWRFPRLDASPGLFARAWRYGNLANAIPNLSGTGRWLRHFGLLRRKS